MKTNKTKINYNTGSNEFHYIRAKRNCYPKNNCCSQNDYNNCYDKCNSNWKPCNNKCDHHDKNCLKPNSFPADCCVASLREALEAIINAIECLANPTFTVNVILFTSNGNSFTIPFSKSNLSNIRITKDSIIFNDLAISLNSIVKIEILSNSVSSSFTNSLLDCLEDITDSCNGNCHNPYLAVDTLIVYIYC